jgi:fructose-1,6-bisphosphatase I
MPAELEEAIIVTSIVETIYKCCMNISETIRTKNPTEIGKTLGTDNTSGDHIKYLDKYSHDILIEGLEKNDYIYGIISEEYSDIMYTKSADSHYIVAFDPIDGSNNIEFNITTGTIFAIYKLDENKKIRDGNSIITSGYCLYGGTTEFIYYDLETHAVKMLKVNDDKDNTVIIPNVKIPTKGKMYSLNQGYQCNWIQKGMTKFVTNLGQQGYGLRYVGSMVADVHRVIMSGGIFIYPADTKHINGKIRLYYEAYPMAFLVEKIGGYATSMDPEWTNILDINAPINIHTKVPFAIGSSYEMSCLNKILYPKNDEK